MRGQRCSHVHLPAFAAMTASLCLGLCLCLCLCMTAATPLPGPGYRSKQSAAYKEEAVPASEDHLFGDEDFPLRAHAYDRSDTRELAGSPGFPGHERSKWHRNQHPLAVGDGGSFGLNQGRPDPFSGFFFDMQDMMKILRDQMSVVLARVPPKSAVGHGHGHVDHLSPSDVRNQTSSKVDFVDGHKVIINDTTYSDGNTNSGSIFHVQIVDLLPLDPAGSSTSAAAPAPAPASGFWPGINEVPSSSDPKSNPDPNRDVEQVEEEDEDDLGEDFEETNKKEAEKPKADDKKELPKEDKVGGKGTGGVEILPKSDKGGSAPKAGPGKDPVEKPEVEEIDRVSRVDEKAQKGGESEEVEVLEDDTGDEEEGEDIPDAEEKVQQRGGSLQTSESRWQNEIDNGIDAYQPYYDYQPYYNSYRPKTEYNAPKRTSHSTYTLNPTHIKAYNRPNNLINQDTDYNNRFVDLSGDTKVNDFMADQQQAGLIMVDPDAEIIDIQKKPVPKYHYPRYDYRRY